MNDLPLISTVSVANKNKILSTLTLAFIADPFQRWINPLASEYLANFPRIVDAYCGAGFEQETAFADQMYPGAAIWMSPGNEPNEDATVAIIEETVGSPRKETLYQILEEMDKYHPHDEPLWYLPFIGVDPRSQRGGIGAALMKHVLQFCDDQNMRAYLESSNPDNIPLYERHGFEVMTRIQIRDAPPVHPMIREKQ